MSSKMADNGRGRASQLGQANARDRRSRPNRGKRIRTFALSIGLPILLATGGIGWIALNAFTVKDELDAAVVLVGQLEQEVANSDVHAANQTVAELKRHTGAARTAVNDPLWTVASEFPWVGPNLSAAAEVARSADDVVALGLSPLIGVYTSLDWKSLLPGSSSPDLEPLRAAGPTVASSAYAVRQSSERLQAIDESELLSQVSTPLREAKAKLGEASRALDSAADAATLAPGMLGRDNAKNYLLMVQNNSEARASGGIPGALAILTLDQGRLTLGQQSSASEVGRMSPLVPVDLQQQQIYSTRLGRYMQDVNLTPDFPTAAATARAMWERTTGQNVDGVISLDPIVLSYMLEATGPVSVGGGELGSVEATGLPSNLSASNVVETLLSDVYAKITQPHVQDAYFAGVAKEVFSALSSEKADEEALISGIARGVEEGRLRIWSADSYQQSLISKYALSGSVSGPSIAPAQFGAYFNDGTGAKMDYYVKRSVQLVTECPADGYEQTTMRITSTNTAPLNAATSLPQYVTGGGAFGVPEGTVQTNIVAYGPVQAQIESATVDGQKTPFAPYLHEDRPVGVLAQQLAPGESKTVEFTFGKIVQHTEPELDVTPSVQPVHDVVLKTEVPVCG